MNIIFLDIDGVLNDWERPGIPNAYDPEIVPRCVQALNRILFHTSAKLVLSSSWRYLIYQGHMSQNGFGKLLRSHGVAGELIGYTRRDSDDEDYDHRYQQIADWLKEHQIGGRYCILDDDPDAFGGRPGVLTAGYVGLTTVDADLAIKILQGET